VTPGSREQARVNATQHKPAIVILSEAKDLEGWPVIVARA
jgi:hypothetical protein